MANTDQELDLYTAASNGALEKVKELLKAGVDVNAADDKGVTPIFYALHEQIFLKKDVMAVFMALVDAGADIHHVAGNGANPLLAAVIERQYLPAKYMVEKGVDVNLRFNTNGAGALDELAIKESKAPMDFKMTKTVNGKEVEVTSLEEMEKILGAKPGSEMGKILSLGRLFLDNGYDVDGVNNNGQTALFTAAGENGYDTAHMLLEAGADPNISCKDGLTAMHHACRYGRIIILKDLIKHGGDLNAVDNYGFCPLLEAAERGELEAMKVLEEAGANMDIKLQGDYEDMKKGDSALDIATKKGHKEMIKYLKSLKKKS